MTPFNYLDEAEEWMDKHASGPISVYVGNPSLCARCGKQRFAHGRFARCPFPAVDIQMMFGKVVASRDPQWEPATPVRVELEWE